MQKLFVYILFYFFILSCDDVVPIQDNPLDPGNEDYVEPTIAFLSELNNGDTISTETLSLAWQGNELVTEYRYKLDSFSWTDWFEGASVTLEYLDEGEHIISIQSRYLSGDTSEVVSRLFIVDAVDGPSLMFFPRRHISTQGETVTFHVLAEEVTALMAAEIHLGFDQSKLEIISVTQGSLFQNSQESIFSYELSSGSIEVLTTILSSSSPSVNGTGDLIQIEVKSLQPGLASIYFNSNNRFRDPNNLNISIREFVNARVEVQ